MTDQQFQMVFPALMSWIQQTLATHSAEARPVSSLGSKRLPLYFSKRTLEAAKFVPRKQVPRPPLSAIGLSQFADFERGNYDGITFLDTFFVVEHRASDESLHFHELIHVIQWRLLGPEQFLKLYAWGLETFGYRNSPLEAMAYNAQELFDYSAATFDAEARVETELRKLIS